MTTTMVPQTTLKRLVVRVQLLKSGGNEKPIEVTLDPEEDPKNVSSFRKWLAVFVLCSAAACTTCASSLAVFTYHGVEKRFHVSESVAILSVSLYVEGLGLGPMFLGPLSEFYGRNYIYWGSFFWFFLFNFPCAFAPNIEVFLVFRFLLGVSGSAFLSVAGGSISDFFSNDKVGTPLAVYTLSPFVGPVLGPLVGGFINQHVYWRWTYYVLAIWIGVELLGLFFLVPESYVPVLLKRKAERLRKETGNPAYFAPLERREVGVARTIVISCYKPFQILMHEPMALLLDIWTALLLGILYLAFQAFPIVFAEGHGFNIQETGCSFLGLGVGMLGATLSQPYWNKLYAQDAKKHGGMPPPEARLRVGMAGAVLVPISLYWFAFTSYTSVHWIVPIIASVFLGVGMIYAFTSVFTFLVVAYRPVAASAMAGNSFLRSAFAAAFPLFTRAMYTRLGHVGGSALLAGLTTLILPLPFIFYKFGARLRKNSRFAQ